MSIRRERLAPRIEIEPGLIHSYIPMQPEPENLCDVEVWIKRLDGKDLRFECVQETPCCGRPRKDCTTRGCGCGRNRGRWLLRYPAFDYRDGHVGFRWDCNIHNLPGGRYRAEIRVCGRPCHSFELEAPCCPQFGGTAENQIYQGECGPADGAHEGTSNVFRYWLNYKTTTVEPFDTLDQILRVALAPVQGAWDGPFPELVVSDGVNEERMQVTWVNNKSIGVKASGDIRFMTGACVRFMWTPNNLEAAGWKNPKFIEYGDLYDCGDTEFC